MHTSKTDSACVAVRSYLVRASCETSGTIHCFFFAVYKDTHHTPPLITELRNFADLVNHTPVLRELEDKRGVRLRCARPFSVGTIKDVSGSGASSAGEYTINGIVYHCHCRYPFSKTCWMGPPRPYSTCAPSAPAAWPPARQSIDASRLKLRRDLQPP